MKKWRDEAVRYFCDLFCVQPFSQTCQIMVVVTVAAFLLDYYDIPSKLMMVLPRPVLIVISLGLGIAVLSWIIGIHILDLAKISTFNAMDTGAFVFLTAIPAWFVLQTLLCSFHLYKYIICILCITMCIGTILYRICIRCEQRLESEKRTSNLFDLKEICENTFQSNPGEPVLVDEKDVDYDLLKRDGIINQLYRSIIHSQPDRSYVISLEGAWGSGKTTIINNTKRLLEQKNGDDHEFIVIDDFDPWVYGSQEALLLAMYDTLLNHGGIKYSPYRSSQMLKQLSSAVAEEYIAGNVLHSLIAGGNTPNSSVLRIKKQISSFLESKNRTIVFFVDNLDRISVDNIVFLLKVISTIFDFPRIIYVLSFDRNRVDDILHDTQEMHTRYTEKIIQQEIKVPPISKNELERVYSSCIGNLLISYGVAPNELQGYRIIFGVILQKAPDLRKLKRLINSAFSIVFCDDNILDKHDLLAIEVIAFFDRELYEEIHHHPEFFISHDKSTNLLALGFGLHREQYNREGAEYLRALLAKYPGYEGLLGEMFPNVQRFKNGEDLIPSYSRYDSDADEIAKRARICSGKYFDLYFSYGSNQYLILKRIIEEYLTQINDADGEDAVSVIIFELLITPAQVDQCEWLERFENYLSNIDVRKKIYVAKALLNYIPYASDVSPFLSLSSRSRAEVIIAELLTQCTKEEFEVFTESLTHSYRLVDSISSVLYWLQSGNYRFFFQ
ncbi:MAG: P-loop NTPase fold protein [Faecousia sp.]